MSGISSITDLLVTKLGAVVTATSSSINVLPDSYADPGRLAYDIPTAIILPPGETMSMYSDTGLKKESIVVYEIYVAISAKNRTDMEFNRQAICEGLETDFQWESSPGVRVARQGWITATSIESGDASQAASSRILHKFILQFSYNPRFGDYSANNP